MMTITADSRRARQVRKNLDDDAGSALADQEHSGFPPLSGLTPGQVQRLQKPTVGAQHGLTATPTATARDLPPRGAQSILVTLSGHRQQVRWATDWRLTVSVGRSGPSNTDASAVTLNRDTRPGYSTREQPGDALTAWGAHAPLRPGWDCRSCAAPWPCMPAQQQLRDAYRTRWCALGVLLANLRDQAVIDLTDADPRQVGTRFIGWYRHRTRPQASA